MSSDPTSHPQALHEEMAARARAGQPFCLATVIHTEGSVSARLGAKALLDGQGNVVTGWLGGGCPEGEVRQAARECLADGRPRTVELDLQDELAGMPCGGSMRVFVDPHLARPTLSIAGHGPIAECLARLGSLMGFRVVVSDPAARGEDFPTADQVIERDPDYAQLPTGPECYVVVTTQHKSDHLALLRVLPEENAYVSLVASRRRGAMVRDTLRKRGLPEDRVESLRSPAGLDLGAATPQEIALAIMAEVVACRRAGGTRPPGRGCPAEA